MAEIHIEKKQTSIWMWLIPLLLLAGIVFWWRSGRDADQVGMSGVADSAVAAPAPMDNAAATAAVGDFTRFVAVREEGTDEGRQHAYALGGIRRLTTALESLNPGAGAATDLAEMRRQAEALENSPAESTRHADMVRAAFVAGANVIAMLPNVQEADVPNVRSAAESVKAGSPLLEQKDMIDAFFRAASRTLEPMTRG